MMIFMSEPTTPEIGTAEFEAWWESQYAPAESHNIKRSNIEYVEGTSLELNRIFWELEEDCPGDWVGK